MKKSEISLLAGLCAAVALAAFQVPFSQSCARLRSDTLRLHVVADSNDADDQRVKLKVRDAVLKEASEELAGCKSAEAAANEANALLDVIERAADETLARNGMSYTSRARVVEMYFPAREYGDVRLPEGVYTALRVELGEAAGHNWWCVIYPSLCLPAAEGDPLDDYDAAERELVSEPEQYVFRFKAEELLQRLFARADND